MGILRFKYSWRELSGGRNVSLPTSRFKQFDASLLGFGNGEPDGENLEALAAVFDLEDFTSFCNQMDPHLVVPEYLNKFLDWLFGTIAKKFVQKEKGTDTILWGPLPFYAKFLGDGVLLLWDISEPDPILLGNIVTILRSICTDYRKMFLPEVRKSFTCVPVKLRCGIARGRIISIGARQDYVGPCINLAARLQKLRQFSFAFSKRGFDLDSYFGDEKKDFAIIKAPIRGIGEEELVFVLKKELNELSAEERNHLRP